MTVNCEGCAGCCLDWRPLASVEEHERRGPQQPLDDVYNLVPLTRDDVRAFLDVGYGDAMIPRLWTADAGPSVELDGYEVAAIGGRPAFFVGLRKPRKPVAPFGVDPTWLHACAFLDPETLQCRIHESDLYPDECASYPDHNLALDVESECERVEARFGGERLLDDEPSGSTDGLLLGPQAVGQKVFAYPFPEDLDGVIARAADRALTREDRARFVAAAAASSPGTTAVEESRFEAAVEAVLDADSWVGRAADEWAALAEIDEPVPSLGERVEESRGAPETPGWPE